MTCCNPNCQAHVGNVESHETYSWPLLYHTYKRESLDRLDALREIKAATELEDDCHYILDKIEGIVNKALGSTET